MCKYLTVEPKAVILQSSEPSSVTLFQRNSMKQSGDGTLIIPTKKLSTKYLISSTEPYTSSLDYYYVSQFAIGALNELTKINITLKMKNKNPLEILGKTYDDGDTFQITLGRFETLQVNHNTDLTGTFITSTKSIAVFSGNRCKQFKINYCSHLFTQLPPTNELDNEYIVPPFFGNLETLIQIISESQGYVNISVGTKTTNLPLNGKEGRNIEIASNETTVVESMTPVLVTGFGMGSKSNDPYMTVIPGVHQYVNYYKIMIPDGFTANFICVVFERDAINNLQINGQTVDHYQSVYESLVYSKKLYVIRTFDVSNGTYVLTTTNESNFGMIVYGHDRIDGYAFSGNFVFP
ncbi:IgGFc-binding protein-like [Saccostrea echinata]|uniref:IgGFc-binding protein-like n=1 Tax=Saccostrea echinata TaxID=191078 RepID=UPI002A7F2339|nr:IgGFc-binding protein-like [Saccostrea echinata]